MAESKIVVLWGGRIQARYWRESAITVSVTADMARIVEGGMTHAYSVTEDGRFTVRVWWTYTARAFLDGYDPPYEMHDHPAFKFVDPHTVRPNVETPLAEFVRIPGRGWPRLNQPANLLDRFDAWDRKHKIRVIKAKGRLQRWFDDVRARTRGKYRRFVAAITAPKKGRRLLAARFYKTE